MMSHLDIEDSQGASRFKKDLFSYGHFVSQELDHHASGPAETLVCELSERLQIPLNHARLGPPEDHGRSSWPMENRRLKVFYKE
jgi:hypothetical protein